jgi:signal transduction histidine kinase
MSRGVVRLWLYWNRLRRQRMLWSLTHAHLTVIVVTFGLAVLASLTYTALTDGLTSMDGESVGPALASRLLVTIFPTAMVVFFAAAVVLAAVLPPSALFSFLVARRTTQRLEKLAAATAALRSGDYGTRVEIEGADEVAQLQADFNTMAGELEQTLEQLEAERDKVAALLQARRELVAGVSHELRTPVATVRGYLESLQQAASAGVSPEILARDLTVIESEVLRLQRLIDDLFTLSRAKVNGLDMELGPVDVGAVIRSRVEAMAPLAWERERVELVAEASQDLPLVQTDEGRFDQVLVNLLRNALRHAAPGGIVAVMATAEPDTIRVEVHDTGEGIPPEDLARVWERFYRGSDSRVRDPRGAGLGLALVKELTEAMGGRVAVESTLGKGSVFTVWLPRSKT